MDLRERFHKVILGAGYSENASLMTMISPMNRRQM